MATNHRFEEATYAPKPVADGDPFLYEPFVPGQEDDGILVRAAQADRAKALHEALDALPERQREVMQLVLIGHPQRWIAEVLDISEATVSEHVRKAKATLADELAWLY